MRTEKNTEGSTVQTQSTQGGHYTALVRRNGDWYSCNDEDVEHIDNIHITLHEKGVQQDLYMLFYEAVHIEECIERTEAEITDHEYNTATDSEEEECNAHFKVDADVLKDEAESENCVQESMAVPVRIMEESPAWQAKLEGCVKQLSWSLREQPTVPPNPSDATKPWPDSDDGALWPSKHCAFKKCTWYGDSDSALEQHLKEAHAAAYACAETWLDKSGHFQHTWMGLYSAAIAHIERQGAPTVGCSLDRRAAQAFSARHSGTNVCAPMCFSCARVLMYDQYDVDREKNKETSESPEIQWRQVFRRDQFCGMDSYDTAKSIGMASYIATYGGGDDTNGNCDAKNGPKLNSDTAKSELEDWKLTVPFKSGNVDILCCPEDRHCDSCSASDLVFNGQTLCPDCRLPTCRECWKDLQAAHRPHLSLANDLWTGYIPEMIYAEKVTYMELLCASVCHPTIMSIQYECYGWDLRKEQVHMQSHRAGARGNFTAFHLPWEQIFKKFGEIENDTNALELPRTGQRLSELVQVVLMAQGETFDERIVSQATVRRNVVVKLIQCLHDRGHRNYVGLNMADVTKHAENLVPNANDGNDPRIPDEVRVILNKKLRCDVRQPGKASAPPNPLAQEEEDPHRNALVGCVTMDITDDTEMDFNVRTGTAFAAAAEKLADNTCCDAETNLQDEYVAKVQV